MTAVEYLEESLNFDGYLSQHTIDKSKKMEKQQIIDAFEEGENNGVDYFNPENRIKESEQYYNETYKTTT